MRLKNIKKAPFEIATVLATNENIVRLLCDDRPSVLIDKININTTTEELIQKKYIGFYPATESGIQDIDRNTFIIINIEDMSLRSADNNISVSGAIYITTDIAHSLLDNNAIRLLELIDEIEATLENQKLTSAGKVQLNSVNYVVFSDFRSGYRINFRFNDQATRKAEL